MDSDQIEPASDTTGRDLPAPMPGGRAPTSRAGGQDPGGSSNVVTVIAAAIMNSSMITHSIIITVIVTISVLTAALALEWRVGR
jgi:hypothetical protein